MNPAEIVPLNKMRETFPRLEEFGQRLHEHLYPEKGSLLDLVRQNGDLGVQFKRGEVAPVTSTSRGLGIDGYPCDLIVTSDGTVRLLEELQRAKAAIELALEGYKTFK